MSWPACGVTLLQARFGATSFRVFDKFCRAVQPEEIAANDYDLNITRYVDTFEEDEEVDIAANLKELAEIDAELDMLEQEMTGHPEALEIVK